MNLETTHYIDGHEIKIGVRVPHHVQSTRFECKISTECVAENPFAWKAIAVIGRSTLFTTAEYPTPEQAGVAAEAELETRMARSLGDDCAN